VELSPAQALYRSDLGTALFQAGELAGAEQQIRTSLELNSQNADAHNVLGAIHGNRNDLPGAIAAFRAALRINPRHPDAQSNLKDALQVQQKSQAR
jgi:Flp pilus assembly protein TadD